MRGLVLAAGVLVTFLLMAALAYCVYAGSQADGTWALAAAGVLSPTLVAFVTLFALAYLRAGRSDREEYLEARGLCPACGTRLGGDGVCPACGRRGASR